LHSDLIQPPLRPLMDLHWPVHGLRPHTRPLAFQRGLMLTSLELLEKLQKELLEEPLVRPGAGSMNPASCRVEKMGEDVALVLDTPGFSPEELSVKQVGRKLQVSGKSEQKQEDGKGSSSYRIQEFRREFHLPEGVNPEEVTCSFADGQLSIKAPMKPVADDPERNLPINCSGAVKTTEKEQSSEPQTYTSSEPAGWS
uniref:SHSP domain-containing protein n=1 Tax=Denticeps clupeoides TaxID=299321 RepID=A0AAY4A356_9TELE